MKKVKKLSKFSVALIVIILSVTFYLFLLSSCSGEKGVSEPGQESGIYVLRVAWPSRGASSRFLPETAHTIEVSITGSGISTQIVTSITSPETELTVSDIPAGAKIALIQARDSSSNLLCQRKESFTITNGGTTESNNIPLGVAVVQDETDIIFEPDSIKVPPDTSLPFQNWTEEDVTITGLPGGNMTLNKASQDPQGKWIFNTDARTIIADIDALISGYSGTCGIDLDIKDWQGASIIDPGAGQNCDQPQIAFDSGGNAMCVFKRYDSAIYRIWANHYVAASATWEGAQLIDAGARATDYPQVAMDSNGNAICVFKQDDGTYDRIYANRYVAASSTWLGAQIIDKGTGKDAQIPQIAFDTSGNAFCVFYQSDGTSYRVYANRYAASSSTWQGAQLADSGTPVSPRYPQIDFDSAGNAFCVFSQADGTNHRVYANRYVAASSSWQTAELISSELGEGALSDSLTPQIDFDPNGNAICVFKQSFNPKGKIYANRYVAASSSWQGTERIDMGGTNSATDPRVAVDSSGNAICVFAQGPASYRIYANHYSASSSSWLGANTIDAGTQAANYPQIAIDSSGNALCVFQQSDGSKTRIYANRYDPSSSSWQEAQIIDVGPGNDANKPQVAFDLNGNAFCVFRQYDGSKYRLYANRYE